MPSFAQATIVGHLGQDPEVRYTQGGDSVTSASVATTRKRKDGEVTTWWRCTIWGKRGEALAKYARKGTPILFTGEPFTRDWQDRQGQTRTSLELDVKDWAFVQGKGEQAAQSGNFNQQPAQQRPAQDFGAEVPF